MATSGINETIETGHMYRVRDAATNIWKRISFWTKASDVENNAGLRLEDTIGKIKGFTSNLGVTAPGYALDATAGTNLLNKIEAVDDRCDDLSGQCSALQTVDSSLDGRITSLATRTTNLENTTKVTLKYFTSWSEVFCVRGDANSYVIFIPIAFLSTPESATITTQVQFQIVSGNDLLATTAGTPSSIQVCSTGVRLTYPRPSGSPVINGGVATSLQNFSINITYK